MNQNRDDETPSSEHHGEPANVAKEETLEAAISKKHTDGSPPPNARPKYEQTRAYAYGYLFAQYLLAGVAAVGIAVAICSLKSLNESVKAANAQAQAAFAAVRPWLQVSNYGIPDLKDFSTRFTIKVKNVGTTPSTGVAINWWLVYQDRNKEPPKMGDACSGADGTHYGAMEAKSPPYSYDLPIDRGTTDQREAVSLGHARVFLRGCLHYGLQGKLFGDTEFCAELYTQPAHPGATITCDQQSAEIMS